MKNDDPRTEAIFHQALARPAGERAAFLAGACRGEPELQARLEALLGAHGQAGGFLPAEGEERRVRTVTAESPLTEGEGTLVGRYKLLERLGEGGFGAVWAAEQREPVRRRVALKIIKLGMDTKQVVARFEAERQALALMDHPNIAKVLDAGTTDTGRPFFVMELVKGIPITRYCDQERLETKARLDLFIKVCHAIQHAHQKGIIHRDIKPSNILVTLHDGVPVPKVIDFGIAKATQQELTDKTIYTQFNQFIGTPAYMSPEQAEMSGLDIDTRSDIYSLGVLLYEMLTGSTPFDTSELMQSGLDEMRRIIREREPIRPSTRLSQSFAGGNAGNAQAPKAKESSRRVLHEVRGDLDWIVMKCLEKDRTRRYETANGLSMDLKRHLDHEPIVARPPSAGYRVRKAWQRNKVAFSAAAMVAVALIAGGAISAWQAAVAQKARRAEERQRLAAEQSSREATANAGSAERQRRLAETNAATAQAAIALAKDRENQMLRRAYAADLNLADQAIKNNNFGRALDLLNRYRPNAGEPELRGWEWRYLWSLCRSEAAFELARLPDAALSMSISPDGKWVAAGGANRSGIRIFDLAERREIARLADGEGFCHAAFSPDGRWLACSTGKSLTLWDCARRETAAQSPVDHSVVSVGFSGDSQKIVTYTANDAITVWDAATLRELKAYRVPFGHAWLGTPFAFTPDLKVAVRPEGYETLVAVELETGEERWRMTSDKGFVQGLAISPDGKWLAGGFGLTDGGIYVFDMATGRQVAAMPGHRAWLSALIFWPDGKKLISASADQTIRVWDMEKFEPLGVLRGHKLEVWSLAFSPQHDTLISGGKDGSVLVWHPRAAKKEPNHARLPGNHAAWGFSKASGILTVESESAKVIEWTGPNLGKKDELFATGVTPGANYRFSPSGARLAALSTNGMLSLWDLKERRKISEFPIAPEEAFLYAFSSDESSVWVVKVLPAARNWKYDLFEWDFARRQLLRSEVEIIAPFAIHPDRWLFAQASPEHGWFRDLQTGEIHRPRMFPGRLAIFYGTSASSEDGEHLAVCHDSGALTVWRTKDLVASANPQPVRTLGGILMSFKSAGFSPDGDRLFGGSHGSEAVKIWETATYHELLTLGAPAENFEQARLSPDGRSLVASASDSGVFVWQAASWEEIRRAEELEKEARAE